MEYGMFTHVTYWNPFNIRPRPSMLIFLFSPHNAGD